MQIQIPSFLSDDEIERDQSFFITKVFRWMGYALCITASFSYCIAQSPKLISAIFGHKIFLVVMIIGELFLVIRLVRNIKTLSVNQAVFAFTAYSAINGITLASLFLKFMEGSLVSTSI